MGDCIGKSCNVLATRATAFASLRLASGALVAKGRFGIQAPCLFGCGGSDRWRHYALECEALREMFRNIFPRAALAFEHMTFATFACLAHPGSVPETTVVWGGLLAQVFVLCHGRSSHGGGPINESMLRAVAGQLATRAPRMRSAIRHVMQVPD